VKEAHRIFRLNSTRARAHTHTHTQTHTQTNTQCNYYFITFTLAARRLFLSCDLFRQGHIQVSTVLSLQTNSVPSQLSDAHCFCQLLCTQKMSMQLNKRLKTTKKQMAVKQPNVSSSVLSRRLTFNSPTSTLTSRAH
jgi:hypothetical protein